MKTITLIMVAAAGSLAANGADTTPAETSCPAADTACCPQNTDNTACTDNCWLDIETITIEAANGNPIAQYAIAWLTENGVSDTPKDPEKAKDMYSKALPGLEKAAREGNPTACYALANMYATGKGVEKDPAKAKEIMQWCKDCNKDKTQSPDTTTPAPAADSNAQQPTEM